MEQYSPKGCFPLLQVPGPPGFSSLPIFIMEVFVFMDFCSNLHHSTPHIENTMHRDMTMNRVTSVTEAYEAPVCSVWSFEGQALCQTSLGAGEIQPGTGENWGTF